MIGLLICLRSEHCLLIVIYPCVSRTIFLDSTRSKAKDFSKIKKVLDEALHNYHHNGGVILTKKYDNVTKVLRFGHRTDFFCL